MSKPELKIERNVVSDRLEKYTKQEIIVALGETHPDDGIWFDGMRRMTKKQLIAEIIEAIERNIDEDAKK